MLILGVWTISIFATIFIARDKNRNIVGWFFLSLFLGPLALLLVLLLDKIERVQDRVIRSSSELSLSSIKAELEDIKVRFRTLGSRLDSLGEKISSLEAKGICQAGVESPMPVKEQVSVVLEKPQTPQPSVSAIEEPKPGPVRKTDIETKLGRFWLNKIGIIIFSLGIAFLLNYTPDRFGPVIRILLGYLVSVALFILGIRWEKTKRFINYGRVILGGSWAITYFTTYAMYHFEASKIIHSQLLDLFLLAIVALGIVVHSLRYKSEALTAIALFVGYFTSTLDVGYFSLISAGLLAVVALVMVYKMQWLRFIFLGIILTYSTHFVWVIRQISISAVTVGRLNVRDVYFLFDAGFLLIYWTLFTVAIHLIKNTRNSSYKRLAAANFSNFILFFFMTYPKFYFFYPEHKFTAVLGFGLVYMILSAIMELIKRKELFISDIIIAISLLTLSIPLRFLPYHTTIIWFIELPFLLFVGFIFKRRVYRYLAFALSLVLFLRFIVSDWQLSEKLWIFSISISWYEFLSFIGCISTAVCYWLYRFFRSKKDTFDSDKLLQNFYSGFSVVYFSIYIWEAVKPLWLTLGFSVVSLLIFIFGVLLLDKYIRWYALTIIALASIRFCFYDCYYDSKLPQVLLIYGPIACVFTEYFIYRRLIRKSLILEPEIWFAKLLFFVADSLLVFAIVRYVEPAWITLTIAIVAILTLLWGVKISDKYIRIYALLILILASLRFSFIDTNYDLSKILEWSLICAKLACAYGAYFIYRSIDKRLCLDESERILIKPIFYTSSFLVVLVIFRYIKDIWASVALGIAGVFLFVTGFLINDKIFRHGGFIIFSITLARIVFVDLSELPTIYKIISFIIVGVLFLGVSFLYTKYMTEKSNEKV